MLYVEHHVMYTEEAIYLRDEILDNIEWDRYDNPFERKSVLPKPYLGNIDRELDQIRACIGIAEDLLGYELHPDEEDHYTAVFGYGVGDYLAMHQDAKRDPQTNREKVITACLYLSTDDQVGSPLEFYSGEVPERRTAVIEPIFNTLVMFDGQWHGCPEPVLCGTRIVATVSFMGQPIEEGRQRAYFAPRPGEVWSKEKCELRDLRCDPFRYHEVYRV